MMNYLIRDSYQSIFSEPANLYKRKAGIKNRSPAKEDPVFLDLLSDYAWKLVMTAKGAEKEVIHLLNTFLKPTNPIDHITLRTVEQQSELHGGKRSVYDICCEQEGKQIFIIEMQNRDQSFFNRRINFYGCRGIANQVAAGDREYLYLPVTLVSFLGFKMRGLASDRYHHIFDGGSWQDESLDFKEKFKAHVFELKKYKKKRLDQLETDEDKWVYIIRNMGKLKEIPEIFDNVTFRPIFERARFRSLKKGEQMEYRTTMDASLDEANRLHFREEKGIRKGIRKGRQDMKKKMTEMKMSMITDALREGLDTVLIAKLVKVDLKTVEEVRAKLALSENTQE